MYFFIKKHPADPDINNVKMVSYTAIGFKTRPRLYQQDGLCYLCIVQLLRDRRSEGS